MNEFTDETVARADGFVQSIESFFCCFVICACVFSILFYFFYYSLSLLLEHLFCKKNVPGFYFILGGNR